MNARRELPSVDAVQAQIDDFFAPGERARVRDWATTAEGRAALQAHHDHLASLPRPCAPEPMP